MCQFITPILEFAASISHLEAITDMTTDEIRDYMLGRRITAGRSSVAARCTTSNTVGRSSDDARCTRLTERKTSEDAICTRLTEEKSSN